MTEEQTREEIVRYFRKSYELGFVNMFEGNISARIGEKVLITPSQQNKETITPDMLSELSLDGELLKENGKAPSSEYRMHLALYRLRSDINAVVHVHSPFATAWAVNDRPVKGRPGRSICSSEERFRSAVTGHRVQIMFFWTSDGIL